MSFFPPAIGKADGKLVAVKHALKTDTFVASSVAAGANVAVTGLSITHEVSDPDNLLIISAYFGIGASSDGRALCGIAIAEDASLIGTGDADGARTLVGAGGQSQPTASGANVAYPSLYFAHNPGVGEKTYTVRAVNIRNDTRTLYVNRTEDDVNGSFYPRASSALVIQEVRP